MAADAAAIEAVAAIVQRLGVMMGAGVAPGNAWLYLRDLAADAPTPAPEHSRAVVRSTEAKASADLVVARVAASIERGVAIPPAIVDAASSGGPRSSNVSDAWRAVGAAWYVAIESGAPLAGTLSETADVLRQLGALHRDVDAALAGPRSTARFVGLMPVVGLLFGTLLGFDTLGMLFGSVPGLVCLVVGGALSVGAMRWTSALVGRARPTELSPGLTAQLIAIALAGGGAIPRARQLAIDARERAGLENAAATTGLAEVDRILALSRRAGVPAADLLHSEARQLRREHTSAAQLEAAKLGTTLMIPLGVCVLPAFMLLGVAPMMLAVLSSTVGSLR